MSVLIIEFLKMPDQNNPDQTIALWKTEVVSINIMQKPLTPQAVSVCENRDL